MTRYSFLAAAMLAALPTLPAAAHEAGHSYLQILNDDGWQLRADLALDDVANVVELDDDGDGSVIWAEIERAQPGVLDYVRQRIRLDADQRRCALTALPDASAMTEHAGKPHLSLLFLVDCVERARPESVASTLFNDVNSDHVSVIRSADRSTVTARSLTADAPRAELLWNR